MRGRERGHWANLLPYALWDISNYFWRRLRWRCDPVFAKLRSDPPRVFFSPVGEAWTCPPLIFRSGMCYRSVVLATQAVRKLWRCIGFRSTAFNPMWLRDCCTGFCVFFCYLWKCLSSRLEQFFFLEGHSCGRCFVPFYFWWQFFKVWMQDLQ